MELTLAEYLQGAFSLIFVAVVIFISIHFFIRYKRYLDRNLLYIGIAWIVFSFLWLPDAINLILIILFDTYLSLELYYIFVLGFLPLSCGFWMLVMTNLMYKNNQKIILLIFFIIYGILETIFLIMLFSDANSVGTYTSPFDVESKLFGQLYLLITLVTFEVTGLLLARQSLRSEEPHIKLKGKFLLYAFICFAIGGLIEIFTPAIELTVALGRSITILSAIFFYIGFVLPDFIKKRFIKNS